MVDKRSCDGALSTETCCSGIESTIISSMVENEKITEWLASAGKTSEPKLLYRASRDGWGASDLHRMCDGKGATVTVIVVVTSLEDTLMLLGRVRRVLDNTVPLLSPFCLA